MFVTLSFDRRCGALGGTKPQKVYLYKQQAHRICHLDATELLWTTFLTDRL